MNGREGDGKGVGMEKGKRKGKGDETNIGALCGVGGLRGELLDEFADAVLAGEGEVGRRVYGFGGLLGHGGFVSRYRIRDEMR